MKRLTRILIATMLLLVLPMKHFAQQPTLIKVSEFNISNIATIEERVFMLHSISDKGYFCFKNTEIPNTIDVYVKSDASDELSDFDFFYDHLLYDQLNDFSLLDKATRGNLFVQWRQGLDSDVYKMLYEDFTKGMRSDNPTCETSLPFCTNNGMYNFPAGVDAGSAGTGDPYHCATGDGHQGQDNCLSTSPNPAFYFMRIDEPGNLDIHMYSTPSHDIDFDCWGPFDDMTDACDQLSCDNMVDCCYSTASTEHCHINNAQNGQYYILLITNYSNQPCNINFQNQGTGTTDCSILPPLVNNDGPYCVGETIHLTAVGQSGATYSWSGPNGFSSTEQNPTINNCNMSMLGTYTCTITFGGESNSSTTDILILSLPETSFDATMVCVGNATEFTSTATVTGQHFGAYEWDFGDGTTGSGEQVSHTYAQAGTYTVTHTARTNGGCQNEVTQTVNVYAMPVPVATAEPYSVQYAEAATITVNPGAEGSFTYHWEPADMVLDPDSQTTQTVPLIESQVYTVTVTNTQGGCTSTTNVTVAMDGSNLTATATADQYEICEGSSTTLHALPVAGTGNYTFSWTPANTLSDPSGRNPVASPAVGTTTYSCHVSDGIISQDVDVTIMVHPNEASEMHLAICEGTSYSFFGQNLNTEGVYRHTLQTQHGCDSIVTLYLGINNIQESQFTVPEEESCDSYYWDPRGHQIVQTDHNDMTYTQSGTYHRTYKDIADCDSIVTMNVQFEYTPHPTPIYPMDPSNETPHWVVTATEFQINTYDFQLWDTNPLCYWDTVTWSCEGAPDWIVEPFGPKSKNCKLYVLDIVPDTIWLTARAFNRCAPDDGVEQKYWLVCSFYGIGDQSSSLADFSVVPNPNNGLMTLNFEHLTGKVNIKVYNMQGALIDSFETYNGGDSLSYTYAMRDKADGIYFFVASGREGTKAKKVIIQH